MWSRLNPRYWISEGGFYVAFVLLVVAFSIIGGGRFFSVFNFEVVLTDAAPLLVMGVGMGLVMLSGEYDLSVGGTGLACAAVCTGLIRGGMAIGLALLISLVLGAALGAVNGLLVAKLGINSLLSTLAMMMALNGLGFIIIGTQAWTLPRGLQGFAAARSFLVTNVVWIAIGVIVVGQVVLSRTRFGRRLVALGSSPRSAELLGVRTQRVRLILYVVSGVCAALAGFLTVAKLGEIMVRSTYGFEFVVLAGVVLGGIRLSGGKGTIFPGVVLGVLLLSLIDNGLIVVGASVYAAPVVQGVIIVVAAYAYLAGSRYRLTARRSARSVKSEPDTEPGKGT
jgi:ribose/xylose/arabinose/galactoside ABC-type transport system permease subunit